MDRRVAATAAGAAAVAGLLTLVTLAGQDASPRQPAPSTFAHTVASLSERGGYFDTDNLISNESSYLQVIPELERRGLRGGAYIGVGPDQNFSYIAATRPALAFIVDIRRDNLLLHLLFKALFRLSSNRIEYMSLLFGRAPPADDPSWRTAGIDRLMRHVDGAGRADRDALRTRIDRTIRSFGVPLSEGDRRTIDDFHQRFVEAGLSLRFQSAGRPPQDYYPAYRELLADTDGAGRQSNFLASEDAFQFVRALEDRDLVIPVIGDVSGPSAIAGIGALLAARHERVTAFYMSNVEFYLFREGAFPKFAANLRALPHDGNAVVIRAVFGRYALGPARPGDDSVTGVQSIDALLAAEAAGRIQRYADLLSGR